MKLLLVENSERLRASLQHGLGAAGFTVDAAAERIEALDAGANDAIVGSHDGLRLPRWPFSVIQG